MQYRDSLFLLSVLASFFSLKAAFLQADEEIHWTDPQQIQAYRRPVDFSWRPGPPWIFTANSGSGSISALDLLSGKLKEANIGGKPVAIRFLSSNRFVVVDQATGELALYRLNDKSVRQSQRLFVGRGANSLDLTRDRKWIAVGSIWDRRVCLVEVGEELCVTKRLRLEFEPGIIKWTPDGQHAIVLDQFAGEYAVLEKATWEITESGTLTGHQIRGAEFVADDQLVLAHQVLHPDAPTTAENIAAGAVIENVIQEVSVSSDSNQQIGLEPRLIHEIGVPSHGAADPAGLLVRENGQRLIVLAGVNEVAFTNEYGVVGQRVEVGQRPLALLEDNSVELVYCLNQFDQSISVIDLVREQVVQTISLGPKPKETPAQRGEILFHAGNRSRFGWYSCQSCHVDGHTNYQLADTFGDGTAGAPKRVLSLLGGRDNNPWVWNGSMRSLHDQVFKSGVTTMRDAGFSAREANDLVAYLHLLESPPPYRPPVNTDDQELISFGRKVFAERGCDDCHIPPLTYTSDSTFDVGVTDEHGTKKFNPPSLIGVGYRRRLFHDGRAENLSDVFIEHGHQLDESLEEYELQALIRFLESL